jgi:hypothetical protein
VLFPKKFIEEILKKEPGGTSIKLKREQKGHHLVSIGYKYNKKHVLDFMMSESTGSMEDGRPYQMKFPDAFGNVHVHSIPRPEVISDFFMILIVLIFTINL